MSSLTCTSTQAVYTLSLHDALPISRVDQPDHDHGLLGRPGIPREELKERRPGSELQRILLGLTHQLRDPRDTDRKSTRLNSSHDNISYAVFCLKKKNHA